MRERAERLGGELRLHSELGHGTEVAVTVPLS
jgi:signal transduction histidine kinase